MSGPSDKAVEAAVAECTRLLNDATDGNDAAKEALTAAHDPALGLDRSVCLRDVIETLRREGEATDEGGTGWDYLLPEGPVAADFLEREFTTERNTHA